MELGGHAAHVEGAPPTGEREDGDGQPLDEDMLITGVTFRRSRRDGTTTTLTLVPRGALSLLPTEAA